ncbi:hypothetical protein [Nguyenibacter sp. L1]|uniref:hypothetical protein n=1 Tax=Nguyenibacter sp. L1 TaxID=3049350 RepID=UPI002B475A66|nr:hypothetical protein [Nguyenibacter sp. L1]WRH89356.1 hypothetical protein QN315_07070 [Nguyenibacter sp. L1]
MKFISCFFILAVFSVCFILLFDYNQFIGPSSIFITSLAGLLSALFWGEAAQNETKKVSNAVAAAFSGSVASFGAASVDFQKMMDFPKWLAFSQPYMSMFLFSLGLIMSTLASISVVIPRLQKLILKFPFDDSGSSF